ncbi:MAG: heparinase II/III family protein [Thermoguttaceae bacterium]|nr:heparinase II/III family protein [Thermoguttaceae bacterium]
MKTHINPAFMILLFAFCLASNLAFAEESVPDYFARLNPVHPRILASSQREAEVKELLQKDEFLQKLLQNQMLEADALVKNPQTVEYIIIGPRLLTQSRRCLKKVLTLAGAYRMTDDAAKKTEYKTRAVKELEAAAAFPDWNPSHFLDTAEMTAAFAIGYDWFFDDLTESEKELLVNSIYEKGLVPSLTHGGWRNSAYNWNQVCNGGMAMGALAIADALPPEKRDTANKILHLSITTVPKAMASFAPDGLWKEGPGYWQYTLLYTTFLVNTLEASLGSDFGITNVQGFDMTVDSQMALATPEGGAFNFADAGSSIISNSMHFWLADRYNNPFYAEFEREQIQTKTNNFVSLSADRPHADTSLYPTNIWYYSPKRANLQEMKLDLYFREAEIATMRSKWLDQNALYVGFKAGSNAVNHGHLDLGSFILVKNGVRWAIDLGADNYNLPGYFGKLRWTYYRLNTHGHNTLLIDGQNQNSKAMVKITDFQSTPEKGSATADLSEAYKDQLVSATRTVVLDRSRMTVSIKDVFGKRVNDSVQTISWQMHTQAAIELADNGKTAILTKEGKTLRAQIASSTNPDVQFQVAQTTQTPDENPNKGIFVLKIDVPALDEVQELVVEFHD